MSHEDFELGKAELLERVRQIAKKTVERMLPIVLASIARDSSRSRKIRKQAKMALRKINASPTREGIQSGETNAQP